MEQTKFMQLVRIESYVDQQLKRIQNSPIKELVITNTVPLTEKKQIEKR